MEIQLHVMTRTDGVTFIIGVPPENMPVAKEFMRLFHYDETAQATSSVQYATVELIERVQAFVKANEQDLPKLHRLRRLLETCNEGEPFLLLPGEPADTKSRLSFERALAQLAGSSAADTDAATDEVFGRIIDEYELVGKRTDRHAVLYEKPRPERTCRFCGGTMVSGATFKKDAHTISRGFGNVHLKHAAECDACNAHFGNTIEPALLALTVLERTVMDIQGRGKNGGHPRAEFANGALVHDGERFSVSSRNVDETDDGNLTVRMGKGTDFAPIDCYRALAKFALSILPDEVMADLEETARWVRYGSNEDIRLPGVARVMAPLLSDPSAQLVIYVRKSEKSFLPHVVGEFRIGPFVNVFVLPFSRRDKGNLMNFFSDSEFQRVFRHYAAVEGWKHVDLSERRLRSIAPVLKFVPKEIEGM